MSSFTVVYDACVLYPAPLRSFLMYLALSGLFRARWTNDIHEEWMRNAVRDYPGFTRDKAEIVRDLMNKHVLDAVVTGHESLIPSLKLPDANDRHVLAAAILCGAQVIVTINLKDFPDESLRPYGVEAQHPDDFIMHQFDLSPGLVCSAAKRQRASLKKPPMSVQEFLASLEKQGLPQTVTSLRKYAELI